MKDGYPPFSTDDWEWFDREVRKRVSNPDAIQAIARRKAGLDLELPIKLSDDASLAETALAELTEEVCLELQKLAAERLGVAAPVVYVWEHPHSYAKDNLFYATNNT